MQYDAHTIHFIVPNFNFLNISRIKLGIVKTMYKAREPLSILIKILQKTVLPLITPSYQFWGEHRVPRNWFSKYLINEKDIKSYIKF